LIRFIYSLTPMPFKPYKLLIVSLTCIFLGGAVTLYALTIPTALPPYEASLSQLYLGNSSQANLTGNSGSAVIPQGFTAGKTQGTTDINTNNGILSTIAGGEGNTIV